ncbi:MAG: prenyltransferase [bacterium]|nr:prenyltransferase [bacterium]
MTNISSFAGVARAPFLLLPVTLVVCGAGVGVHDGNFRWDRTAIALVGLMALHMAVNIFNEWSDYRTGIDLNTERTPFTGGSGTLPQGKISPNTTLAFGLVCAAIGLGVGVYFRLVLGPLMLVFIAVGALCVLTYTDLLARVGLGEVAAGLGLGMLPVTGVAYVQAESITATAIAASIPAFLMTFNLLLLNEFPDETADREGGRMNLVILLGRRPAALLWTAAAIATPASIIAAWALGYLPIAALAATAPSLLLVGAFRWALGNSDESVPIPALGSNVIWNLATNVVLGVSLIVTA